MTEEFLLPIKPFSINRMYYNNRAIKTTEAREWSCTVFDVLAQSENQEKLANLRDFFDKARHQISIELIAYYPEALYYTKKGDLSSRTFDISNWEKPLIDLIFLPKYMEQPVPYGCPNLNADDRYLTEMKSSKKPAEQHKIYIKIQIQSL